MFDLFGTIGDALSSIAGAIDAVLLYVLNVFAILFSYVLQVLSVVAQFFLAMLQQIGAFFAHLWQGFFKGILNSLWQHIRDGIQWLHDHLQPIIRAIQRVRAFIDRWYRMYVIPYLNLLQRIRGYLHILALLHIKIAAELDAKLAQVQAQIVQSFATVRASLNAVIDISNAIMDPSYLIRKPALLLSIRRQLPALIHALTGRPAGYWFPSPRGSSAGAFSPVAGKFDFAGGQWSTPPSSYLGDDAGVGDVSAFADAFTLANGAVDDQGPLDYFNDDLYPIPQCADPAQCLAAGLNTLYSPQSNG